MSYSNPNDFSWFINRTVPNLASFWNWYRCLSRYDSRMCNRDGLIRRDRSPDGTHLRCSRGAARVVGASGDVPEPIGGHRGGVNQFESAAATQSFDCHDGSQGDKTFWFSQAGRPRGRVRRARAHAPAAIHAACNFQSNSGEDRFRCSFRRCY